MPKQKVHFGHLQSTGEPGLFTGNTLVMRLQQDNEYYARKAAQVAGFEFETQVTPEQHERALEIVTQPQFWCRAKLFRVLAAAKEKGVLEECLSEMELPDTTIAFINRHLDQWWKPFPDGDTAVAVSGRGNDDVDP